MAHLSSYKNIVETENDVFGVIWMSFWAIYTHAEHLKCGYYTAADYMIAYDIIVIFCIFS